MKSIIITGSSGFVGQNLSLYLPNHQFEIHPLSLRNQNWKNNFNANAIIHLAGKAHDTKNNSDASEYFKVNTDLTKELFDAFIESEIKYLIVFVNH